MRIRGDTTRGLPTRPDGTPTVAIDLRDIRELNDFVETLAAEVSAGDRAYLIVEQGPSGSNDLLYLNERINLFAQVDKFFQLASVHSLVTGQEERASDTHRRLASDIQLASFGRAIALTLASSMALAGIAWKNWRFGNAAASNSKDAVFILELKRRL